MEETGNLAIPVHLQDAHYKGAAKLGHGKDYKYAHDYPNHYVRQQYLPYELSGREFYQPGGMGYEVKIKEHMQRIRRGSGRDRAKAAEWSRAMRQIPKRVMIVSFDAVGAKDLEYLQTPAEFSAFFLNRRRCAAM